MCISLISYESLNQLWHPSSVFSALSFVSTPWTGTFSRDLQPSLSVYRPDSQPQRRSSHRCAPVAAHLCLEQDASCRTMPAIAGAGRPVTYIGYYRWKWYIQPLWQRLRGHRRLTGSMGAAIRMHPMRSGDLWWPARLGGVGDPSFQAPVSAERTVNTHTPPHTSGVHKGERWGARPLAACLPAPSSAEMPTPGWSRTTRSRSWAGRRRGATCSTSATGRTSTVKMISVTMTCGDNKKANSVIKLCRLILRLILECSAFRRNSLLQKKIGPIGIIIVSL